MWVMKVSERPSWNPGTPPPTLPLRHHLHAPQGASCLLPSRYPLSSLPNIPSLSPPTSPSPPVPSSLLSSLSSFPTESPPRPRPVEGGVKGGGISSLRDLLSYFCVIFLLVLCRVVSCSTYLPPLPTSLTLLPGWASPVWPRSQVPFFTTDVVEQAKTRASLWMSTVMNDGHTMLLR